MRYSQLALVTAALSAGLALAPAPAPAQPSDRPPPGLVPTDPIVCNRSENIVLRKRYISTTGDAIASLANCDIQVIDSYIEADGLAVLVAANGDVHIKNSYVSGRDGAIVVRGNGDVVYADSRIDGRMWVTGNGDLIDAGGNVTTSGGRGRPAGAPRDEAPARGNRVSVGGIEVDDGGVRIGGLIDVDAGRGGVRVGGVTVDSEGVNVGGAVVVDEAGVDVGHGAVVVDEAGVDVGRGAVVVDHAGIAVDSAGLILLPEVRTVVEDGYVRIDSGGAAVEVGGDWRRGEARYDTSRVLVELNAVDENDHIRLDLAGDVLFDFDSSAIRADAAAELSKVAHVIRDRGVGKVTVIGHTDSVGDDRYNQRLSEERAVAVMRFLSHHERIPAGVMVGQGAGSKRPIAHNTTPDGRDDPAGRAKNRRVEIQIATRG